MIRAVLDPAGDDEALLLDWGDRTRALTLPWSQNVETVPLIDSDFSAHYARGQVSRQLKLSRRVRFESAAEQLEAQLEAADAISIGKELSLHIRVASLPFPVALPAIGSAGETSATSSHYIAADAVVVSVSPEMVPRTTHLVINYELSLGALVKQ